MEAASAVSTPKGTNKRSEPTSSPEEVITDLNEIKK